MLIYFHLLKNKNSLVKNETFDLNKNCQQMENNFEKCEENGFRWSLFFQVLVWVNRKKNGV